MSGKEYYPIQNVFQKPITILREVNVIQHENLIKE